MGTPQAVVLAPSGYSIEPDFQSGDALAAIDRILERLPQDRGVFGIGAGFAAKLGLAIPGLCEMAPISAKASLAAAPHDALLWLTADSAGEAFDRADELASAARFDFRVAEQVALFRYRDSRDLTGFIDGIGNPVGEEATRAAFIAGGPLAGGSFAFVQRFVHDRAAFAELSAAEQADVIGRTKADAEELEGAPETAHVKRVDQEGFDPPMFILRKSMPWGDLEKNGLLFLAFTRDLDRIEIMRRRMVGAEDGVADSLLRYTRAVTGAYYFCPAIEDGKPDVRALLAK